MKSLLLPRRRVHDVFSLLNCSSCGIEIEAPVNALDGQTNWQADHQNGMDACWWINKKKKTFATHVVKEGKESAFKLHRKRFW